MARTRKPTSPHSYETLPVLRPELSSLPLWCTMLFSLLLVAPTEIFLLRAECALAKARHATFKGLLKKSADFLRTTSENSNCPSSVMSSPIMMRGRCLLESINSVLYPAGEEKPRPDRKKKAEKIAGGDVSGKEKSGGRTAPRKASHPGVAQKIYTPDETKDIYPRECPHCYCREFVRTRKYFLFQAFELVLRKIVTHFRVWEDACNGYGRRVRTEVPQEARWVFGPGFASATVVLTVLGLSRRKIQAFYSIVVQIVISQGGIQKCFDRASATSKSLFMGTLRQIRRLIVSIIEEANSRLFGPAGEAPHWLWAMVCPTHCIFMLQKTRHAEAFAKLIGDWAGILVSDGFAVCLKWAGEARQSCLAHLMRRAKKFEEGHSPEIAQGGHWILTELRYLIKMTGNPPTDGQHAVWSGRFMQGVRKYRKFRSELGAYARHLLREADCTVTFLKYEGVDPTSSAVERALRPYVCHRKISFDQTSMHGEVDIARLLTLHETCRRNGRSTYGELKKALECHARGRSPSLYYIRKAGMTSGTKSLRIYAPNPPARPAESTNNCSLASGYLFCAKDA